MEEIAGVKKQELPVDLLFEILTKLPVKSLCRFLCVSKLWRSVIADPIFVEAHHACAAARPEILILFSGTNPIMEERVHHVCTCKLDDASMELHSPDHRGVTQTYLDFTYPGITSHQAGGLYCIDLSDFVRFWNPTTCEALDIEIPEAETNPPNSISINHFGFDPVEKKHKVLNILTSYSGEEVIRSRVFILEEGCWRTPGNAYPLHTEVPATDMVICIDGIIFSVSDTADLFQQTLTAFHVRSETFEAIPVPRSTWAESLIEFKGRAAIVDEISREGRIILWILEDLRKQVWTRKACLFPAGFDLRRQRLQCGTPTGELLFTGRNSPQSFFLLYNVESGSARKIEFQSLPEFTRQQLRYAVSVKVYFHVDSLKSPKGASSLTSASSTHIKTLNRSESSQGMSILKEIMEIIRDPYALVLFLSTLLIFIGRRCYPSYV